ncbi:MAG: ACP S-malonyltransferase [Planctomycetes bacterium]|nr:ACP S-malonyltransferase [Planctomycetota bacterium]
MKAFLFPGQGAQYVGMGKNLCEQYPAAREVFDKAAELLGFDLAKVCFDGPAQQLTRTSVSQPAILACSIAALRAMGNPQCDAAAGLSLGEYTALVCAQAISLEEALPLVRDRGEYMQQAANERPGTMASIIGLEREQVQDAVARAADAGIVTAANFNSPGQVVVSGEEKAVSRACEIAGEMGCKRAIKLKVSGAFHSPLMEPARIKLAKRLEAVEIKAPRCTVVANVTARPAETPEQIRDLLARQVTSPVLWQDSMRHLASQGIGRFYEIGPGKVLAGLMRRIVPDATTTNVDGPETLEKINGI